MENIATILLIIAAVAGVIYVIRRKDKGDGPGSSGTSGGGNSRPGTGQQ